MVKVVSEIADRHAAPEVLQTYKSDNTSANFCGGTNSVSNPIQSQISDEISTVINDTDEASSVYPDIKLDNSPEKIVIKSRDEHLNKIKMLRKALSYNKTGFFQKALAFFSLAYNYEDDGTDEFLADLMYKMQNKSPLQKQELIKEYYEDTRLNIDLPQTEKTLKRISWFKKISSSIVKYVTKNFSDKRSFNTQLALSAIKNPQERELLILGALDDVDIGHKSLKDVVIKYLPEGMSEDEMHEVFYALGKFADNQAEDILAAIKSGNFKEKFVDLVRKKAQQVIETARKRTKEFIKSFWESAKGRTVKRTFARAYGKVLHAKKEVADCKEKTDKAILEAKDKKAECEKAIIKAKEEEIKAKNIAESYGCKNLEGDKLYKFVKQKSPAQAYDLMRAQENKEKARWAQYDANSAKKYAELLESIANRHFEFEKLKMDATIAQMQALLKMPIG